MVKPYGAAAKSQTAHSSKAEAATATKALLAWYDANRRALPWRAMPGERMAPYRVWLSEIMLQQTTVEAVKPYFMRFLARWPDVAALAGADDRDVLSAWAGLGYYARARNLIACARQIVADHGGRFPASEAELLRLPGIGAYTAAAIAAIAFGKRALVVDGNVARVVTRLFSIPTPLPAAGKAIRAGLDGITPADRPGDFAQGMMDLGSAICTPRSPACEDCPLARFCAACAAGTQAHFPVKPMKKPRPLREGTAYVVDDGAGRVLLRTRPAKGLLGGMSEVPSSGWEAGADSPPVSADWLPLNTQIRHVFTHFDLRLSIRSAVVSGAPPPGCRWVAEADLAGEPLPTLFRKVLAAAGFTA